ANGQTAIIRNAVRVRTFLKLRKKRNKRRKPGPKVSWRNWHGTDRGWAVAGATPKGSASRRSRRSRRGADVFLRCDSEQRKHEYADHSRHRALDRFGIAAPMPRAQSR